MQKKGQLQFDLGGSQEPRTDPARAPLGSLTPKHFEGLSQPSGAGDWDVPTSKGPAHQLPMFMSQREIMHKYQPLDADLQEQYDEREGEATNRPETTGGYPNPQIRTNDRAAPFLQRQGSAARGATHYRDFGHPESHEEMMSRKLNESQMSYGEYAEHHQGGDLPESTPSWEEMMESTDAPQYKSGHTGTYDFEMNKHIEDKTEEHYSKMNFGSLYGDLQEAMKPGGEGFTSTVHLATGQFGSQGKPQLAGAHHRLAALGEIAPDRLLPVIHHEQMTSARWGSAAKLWKYT